MGGGTVSPPSGNATLSSHALPAARPDVADARRTLLLGPPGAGKSRALRALFERAVAEHGAARALLILPTYGEVEHEKRTSLSSREGRPDMRGLLDAPYATFTSLGERFVPGFRVRDLPSRAERDLWAAEALRAASVPAFEPVRARQGFRARFLRLVKEMKQTGEDPEVLRARLRAGAEALSPAPRERLGGFLAAWERYDALLAKAGRRDHEDALRGLLATLRDGAPPALSSLAFVGVDGFEDLTGLESALLLQVADAVDASGSGSKGRIVVALPFDPARAHLFDSVAPLLARLEPKGFVRRTLSGFERTPCAPLARLATGLFGDSAGSACAPGEDLRTIVGASPTDEIERIAREVLRLRDPEQTDLRLHNAPAPPVHFRDVLVVFRRLDAVAPLARRVFASFGIPTRLVNAGERLASSAPVRALRGPLRLLAGDDGTGDRPFEPALLLDWFRWRALASGRSVRADAVDRADIYGREHGFPADWKTLRERPPPGTEALRADLEDLERTRARAAAAVGPKAVWAVLLDAADRWLPLAGPGGFSPEGRPLDPAGDERLRRAAAAKAQFLRLGEGLRDAALATDLLGNLTAADAVLQWLDGADDAVAEPLDRRLDAVSFVDAEEARHWEAAVVFVAGLVEKAFPLHPPEDVFLRDEDRERLAAAAPRPGPVPAGTGPEGGLALRTSRQGEERERRLFLFAATRARSRLYLSRHATGEDGRAKAPSFFWRDANRALGLAEEDFRSLGRDPPDLARSCVEPSEAVRPSDLDDFVAARLGSLALPEGREARLLAAALAVEGGDGPRSLLARAARFRRSGADEVPESARPLFAEGVAEVSPSQATAAVLCRHVHFLSAIAKVPPPLALSGRPIDRRDMGRLMHRALWRALVEPALAPEAVAQETMREADDLPDSAERAWLAEDLARVVRLFRDRERRLAAAGFAPLLSSLEMPFGARAGKDLTLGSGDGRFGLSGRFDRVDVREQDGRKVAIVVDYKRSRGSVEETFKELKGLTNLQLPLYAAAVEALFGVEVVGLELVAGLVRHRRSLHDGTCEEAIAARREGGAPKGLGEEEFARFVAAAVAATSEAVRAVRAADAASIARAPREPRLCERCDWREVCRPDVLRFLRESRDAREAP